jgi:hypothetical protein
MNTKMIAYTLAAATAVSMYAGQMIGAPAAHANDSPPGQILQRGGYGNAGNGTPGSGWSVATEKCVVDPKAPKPALAVEWKPWPGGITATVKMANNPTKTPVKCVYSTQGLETFDRAFTLAGDQPSDVVIAPAMPLNRFWPVTVSCDNGVRIDTGSVY